MRSPTPPGRAGHVIVGIVGAAIRAILTRGLGDAELFRLAALMDVQPVVEIIHPLRIESPPARARIPLTRVQRLAIEDLGAVGGFGASR
jgi:hypothetical protein